MAKHTLKWFCNESPKCRRCRLIVTMNLSWFFHFAEFYQHEGDSKLNLNILHTSALSWAAAVMWHRRIVSNLRHSQASALQATNSRFSTRTWAFKLYFNFAHAKSNSH